jgi:hypothetical protein
MALSLGRFFGRTASEGAAFALGTAVGPALSPAVRELVNEAWSLYPTRPLGVADLANGVSSGQIPRDWARDEARNTGFDGNRFDHLVAAFDTGPGVALAFELWHRGILTEGGFRRALKRESLEPEWIDALVAARNVLLSPADLATMRQRGYIDAARHHDEAGRQGITAERADLMFENSGLPPGYGELAAMLHRGIITEGEFVQAIREANTKVKYTDELLALARPILSPIQAATLRLKGWIDAAESYRIGALSGYSQEQMDRLFLMQGRPMAPVQMWNAWAREAPGPQGGTFDKADFLRAIKQSDIRPEYGETLWAIRWAYPSLFQLRRLAEDGTLSRAELLDILHKERYEPGLATKIVDGWLRGGGTTAKGLTRSDLEAEYQGGYITRAAYIADLAELGYDAGEAGRIADLHDAKLVRRARDQRVTKTHSLYVRHMIDRGEAQRQLDGAGVTDAAIARILDEWDDERTITPDSLTPAQIKKAFGEALMDRTTAIARLMHRGYEQGDAAIYLDS